MKYESIQEKIDQAIAVREKGDLRKSRVLFEAILKQIKKTITVDKSKKLKQLFATTNGEYIIQHRLEARDLSFQALSLGHQLIKYDNKHKLQNILSIRSVSHTLIDLGQYEKAIKYYKQVEKSIKNNSTRSGDIKAHLAFCYLRTAKLNKAFVLINKAIHKINKNTANIPHLPVYQSYAYLVKALVQYHFKKRSQAQELASKALKLAKKGRYAFRIKEAEQVIDLLKK